MEKISKQSELFNNVEKILQRFSTVLTTAALNRELGNYQTYDSNLRDRLFNLKSKGYPIDFKLTNKTHRVWFLLN